MPRLDRFVHAQDDSVVGWNVALAELRAGRKRSHWIWYVFPQLAGLGMSGNSMRYGIADRDEAVAYLSDARLRARLLSGYGAVVDHLRHGASVVTLMGSRTDALKLVSSLTLFEAVARSMDGTVANDERLRLAEVAEEALFMIEAQGLPRCAYTLRHLQGRP